MSKMIAKQQQKKKMKAKMNRTVVIVTILARYFTDVNANHLT